MNILACLNVCALACDNVCAISASILRYLLVSAFRGGKFWLSNVSSLFSHVDKFTQSSWCTKSTDVNAVQNFSHLQYVTENPNYCKFQSCFMFPQQKVFFDHALTQTFSAYVFILCDTND